MESLGIVLAYLLDLIIGDPEGFVHPVRGIGKLINLLDKRLNRKDTLLIGRIKGVILVFLVVGISVYAGYLFIEFFKKINPLLGNLAWVYLGYTSLAMKDLQVKAKAVLGALKNGTIFEARKALSKIVSRDTGDLSKDRIIVSAIESIAENTNDGIVAPLFYLILGGPVLAIAYKSINTLDSMVGYRNERYLHFGWFSAKLDDLVNFIPARISGFLISLSSVIARHEVPKPAASPLGEQSQNGIASSAFGLLAMTTGPKRFKDSLKVMFRDGKKHPSPNSGVPESAMAGALGIRLGGPSIYEGKILEKPYLGEDKRPIDPLLITEALTISFIISFLMVLLGVFIKWMI